MGTKIDADGAIVGANNIQDVNNSDRLLFFNEMLKRFLKLKFILNKVARRIREMKHVQIKE